MKAIEAIVAGLVVVLAVLGVGATLVSSVHQSSPGVAITASEITEDISAAQTPVRTICRSNDALMELCISSDGRGLFSVFDGVKTAHYVYVFYNAPGDCPQSMPGYQIRVSDWTLRELQFFGFHADDFASLDVSPFYCTFAPVS